MELGLQCSKVYRFVQYFPRKRFNKFVQSVADARREADENLLYGVVAETMKLLGNSSYGYQTMDRARHTITKYSNDEKTNRETNEPLFKRLNTVQKILYEKYSNDEKTNRETNEPLFKRLNTVQKILYEILYRKLLKSTIEHKEHNCRIFHSAVCKAENA